MLSSNIVLTEEHLARVVEHFSKFDAFSFDVETIGAYRGTPAHNQITWLSMATHGMAVAIPMGHEKGDRIIGERIETRETATGKIRKHKIPIWEDAPLQLRPSVVFEAVRRLLFSNRLKIAHNAKFDLGSVAKYYDGQWPDKPWWDTLIHSKLLDENRMNGLKHRVKQLYKLTYDREDVGKQVEAHRFSTVAHYAFMDARYTWLLYQKEKHLCRQAGLQGVLNLGFDVIETELEMEANGAPIIPHRLAELGVELRDRMVGTEAGIYREVGKIFNLNSSKQKAEIFYSPKKAGGLGLKPTTLTPGGQGKKRRGEKLLPTDYSTDAGSLKPYKDHPAISLILDYQKDSKLVSTYVTGLLGDPAEDKPCLIVDGRVHGSFNQLGAGTSRWSSARPNLQNIPTRSADGKKIRGAFQAEDGYKFVIADYSQIELVLLAHFIGHGALFDGFHQGIDAHTTTASKVFGVPFVQVGSEMRAIAKSLNFAIVYGAWAETVGGMAGIPTREAQGHMDVHALEFPEIYEYRECIMEKARRMPVPQVDTILGHLRRIPELRSSDPKKAARAGRQLFNAKIQGSGADVIKLAMVRLLPSLPEGAELIMTVHDELMVHSPVELVPNVEAAMREAMLGEGIQKLLRVPLRSEQHVVDNWAEAKS